jgi:ABC-2 type transport system permease protein
MILAPVLRVRAGLVELLLLTLCLLLVSFTIASLGMVLAARIESLENFSTIMNFVVFPMFFLSGGLYPVKLLPEALRMLVYLNPLTYGIDLFKHVLLPSGAPAPMASDLPVLIDTTVLLAVSIAAVCVAILLFDKDTKLVKLVRKAD